MSHRKKKFFSLKTKLWARHWWHIALCHQLRGRGRQISQFEDWLVYPGQPGLHKEILSWKTKQKTKLCESPWIPHYLQVFSETVYVFVIINILFLTILIFELTTNKTENVYVDFIMNIFPYIMTFLFLLQNAKFYYLQKWQFFFSVLFHSLEFQRH